MNGYCYIFSVSLTAILLFEIAFDKASSIDIGVPFPCGTGFFFFFAFSIVASPA